jgi:hypothetical protein
MNRTLLFGLLALAISSPALAEETTAPPATAPAVTTADATPAATPASTHVMIAPSDFKWGDTPPAFPKGSKMAVLFGDPTQAGPFTLRVTLPAGYRVMPHFHPSDENVTVLSGDFHMGLGDKFDEGSSHALAVGGFASMPQGMHHYAWTKKGATIQVHGVGPFGLTYVNPADDPRTAKEAAK